jgi:hypothetical protein
MFSVLYRVCVTNRSYMICLLHEILRKVIGTCFTLGVVMGNHQGRVEVHPFFNLSLLKLTRRSVSFVHYRSRRYSKWFYPYVIEALEVRSRAASNVVPRYRWGGLPSRFESERPYRSLEAHCPRLRHHLSIIVTS